MRDVRGITLRSLGQRLTIGGLPSPKLTRKAATRAATTPARRVPDRRRRWRHPYRPGSRAGKVFAQNVFAQGTLFVATETNGLYNFAPGS